jgi:hypothetical protein
MSILIERQNALAKELGISREELPDLVSRLKYLLRPRQYEALSGFYGIDRENCRSVSEIANDWGTSKTRVRQVLYRVPSILKREAEDTTNLPADPLDYTFEQLFTSSRIREAAVGRGIMPRIESCLRDRYHGEETLSPMRWLVTQTEAELLKNPNFSHKSVDALRRILRLVGLSLAD